MVKGEPVCGLLYFLAVCLRLVPALTYKIEEEPYIRFATEGNYTAAVGGNFTVECRSNYPINLVRRSERNEEFEEYSDESDYSSNLHIERLPLTDLTYEDVGRIDCVPTFSMSYKASFYLFVDDPVHLMVGPRVARISARNKEPVTVPCIPTAPDVNLNLLTSDGYPMHFSTDPKDENKEVFYYDPTRGIILPGKLMTAYWYIYICEFTKRGVKQRKYIDVMLDGGGQDFIYLEPQGGKERSVVSAQPGTDVKFVAEIFSSFKPLVQWYDTNYNEIKTGKKYTTAHVLGEPGETRLIIHNISLSDAGTYAVKHYARDNVVTQSAMFTLHVQDVQPLEIEMEKVFWISNDNFVAFCRDKFPRLYREITWTIIRYNCYQKNGCIETVSSLKTSQDVDGIEFNPKFPYAILFTKPVLANITCVIEYSDGTQDGVTRPLIVSEAKDGFEIEYKLEKDMTTVELTCTVSRFLYSDNLYWIGHDGFVIENNRTEDERNMTITRSETIYSYRVKLAIEMNDDYMPPVEEYRCMAVNYQHTPSFKSHKLDINSGVAAHFIGGNMNNGSLSVIVEEDLTLRCHAGGVPSPTLNWYKDDMKLDNDGRRDLELHLAMNDTGRYACQMTNDFGEDYVYKDVEVYYPVDISYNDTHHGWTLEERESERVTLLCSDDGEPTHNVTWFRDDDKLHESSSITIKDNGTVISIFPVQEQDSGYYTCRHVIQSHKEQLIVDDSPSIVAPVLGSIFAAVIVFAIIYIVIRIRHLNRLHTPISYHSLLSMT